MTDRSQRREDTANRGRGGALFGLRATGAAIFLAGLCAPVPNALALWDDRLELIAREIVTYDDNVFRLSGDSDPEAALGLSSKADTYNTTELGLRVDVPVSRQRFIGDYVWVDDRYREFTVLNYTGYRGLAAWEWQAGNKLSGELVYSATRSLASLANVFNGVQVSTPNPIKKQTGLFNASYLLTSRWKLRGDLANSSYANEVPEFQVNDVDIARVGLAGSHVSRDGKEVGLVVRHADARYPQLQPVAGTLVDNAYQQYDMAAFVDWEFGGSRLKAQLGWFRRSYDQLSERDFDDSMFLAVYEWKATGKLTLNAEAQRGISETEEITTSFVFVNGIALRPVFNVTEKIAIEGVLAYSTRDYHGDAGEVLGTVEPRSDRLRYGALTVTYRPLRRVWLDAALRRETRSSNVELGDYVTNMFSVSARIGF